MGGHALAGQPARPDRFDRDRRVFFIRGTAGYSPRWRARFTAQPFRTRDFYLYSPLCLALGVGFIKLLTREMH